MNEQALADSFEDATWMIEQPNPDLNFIGLYALSELVREQGFRVILNGRCLRCLDQPQYSLQSQDKGPTRSLAVTRCFCQTT